jgi:hypothetical protein
VTDAWLARNNAIGAPACENVRTGEKMSLGVSGETDDQRCEKQESVKRRTRPSRQPRIQTEMKNDEVNRSRKSTGINSIQVWQ